MQNQQAAEMNVGVGIARNASTEREKKTSHDTFTRYAIFLRSGSEALLAAENRAGATLFARLLR